MKQASTASGLRYDEQERWFPLIFTSRDALPWVDAGWNLSLQWRSSHEKFFDELSSRSNLSWLCFSDDRMFRRQTSSKWRRHANSHSDPEPDHDSDSDRHANADSGKRFCLYSQRGGQ
jgi:hypothetical protein